MTSNQSGGQPDSESLNLGRATAVGATSQFLSKIGQQLVGVVGSILLIRLLISPSIYAFISLATTVPGLVLLGNVSGVSAGLARYLSQSKVQKDSNSIWSLFWSAITVHAVTGALLSVIAFFAATPISALIGKPLVDPFLKLAAPLPFVWTLQLSIKQTMFALERAKIYSAYQIVDEILLSSFPIVAVLLGYGAIGALAAMVAANFVSWGIAMGLAISAVYRETNKENRNFTFLASAKKLIRFGLPQGVSNSFQTFAGQVVNLIIARFVSLDLYGLYSVAVSASSFGTYVSDPVSSIILPVYSRITGTKDRELMKTAFRQTIRYSSLFFFPITIFLIIFATPFTTLLFGSAYSGAGLYLSVLIAGGISTGLPYGLGITAGIALLTSQGYSMYTGTRTAIIFAINIAIAAIVVPTFGLLASLIVSAFVFIPNYVIVVIKLKSALNIRPPLSAVVPIYLAALATALISLPVLFIHLPLLAQVIMGALVVLISYIFFAALFGALNLADVKNLRMMLSTQAILTRAVSPFLTIVERLIILIKTNKDSTQE